MPDSSLVNLLRQAGFRGRALTTAEAVLRAESGGNPQARNTNTGTGDNSYGLFQINMLGGMGPERRSRYGLASNEALYDPLTNAKVAYQLSKGGRDWSPWSTFKSGAYKKYVGSAVPDTPPQPSPLAALTGRPGNPAGGLTEGQIAALLGARQAVGLQTSTPMLQLLAARATPNPAKAGMRVPQAKAPAATLGPGQIAELLDEGTGGPTNSTGPHVHLATKTPAAMLAAITKARQLGLATLENPYVDPVNPAVHAPTSFHKRTFKGSYNGRPLGQAVDVSGQRSKLFLRWASQNLGNR